MYLAWLLGPGGGLHCRERRKVWYVERQPESASTLDQETYRPVPSPRACFLLGYEPRNSGFLSSCTSTRTGMDGRPQQSCVENRNKIFFGQVASYRCSTAHLTKSNHPGSPVQQISHSQARAPETGFEKPNLSSSRSNHDSLPSALLSSLAGVSGASRATLKNTRGDMKKTRKQKKHIPETPNKLTATNKTMPSGKCLHAPKRA